MDVKYTCGLSIPVSIRTYKHNKIVNEDTLRQITLIRPNSAVNVGAGDGFYGKLIRNSFPDCYITAVEPERKWIRTIKHIYDVIITKKIEECIDNLHGDIILFGDVLEHIENHHIQKLLDIAVNNFLFVIVNSPLGFQPQYCGEGSLENHISGLYKETFERYTIIEYMEFLTGKPDGSMLNCVLQHEVIK